MFFMRRVILTKNEKEQLTFIQKNGKTALERNRSMCLLLSNQSKSMSEVARLMNIDRMTVVRLFDAWDGAEADKRFSVLYREEGQGAKPKLETVRNKQCGERIKFIPHISKSIKISIIFVAKMLPK
jgi:DNA-binding CsgD family transcriptional regulator